MLSVGEKAPDFTANDQNDNAFNLYSFTKKGPVVLVFYPKDNSAGCSMQCSSFRDNYDGFTTVAATIVGISSGSKEERRNFIKKYNLPFNLLFDEEKKIAKLFKLSDTFGLIPPRATFVIDSNRIIKMAYSSQVNLFKHVELSLKTVKELQ